VPLVPRSCWASCRLGQGGQPPRPPSDGRLSRCLAFVEASGWAAFERPGEAVTEVVSPASACARSACARARASTRRSKSPTPGGQERAVAPRHCSTWNTGALVVAEPHRLRATPGTGLSCGGLPGFGRNSKPRQPKVALGRRGVVRSLFTSRSDVSPGRIDRTSCRRERPTGCRFGSELPPWPFCTTTGIVTAESELTACGTNSGWADLRSLAVTDWKLRNSSDNLWLNAHPEARAPGRGTMPALAPLPRRGSAGVDHG
jgi:hypothetical protein